MAEADEDAFQPSGGAHAGGSDSEDEEMHDFRFLAALTASTSRTGGALPKRGIKDFEPHATSIQSSALDDSRYAMHAALSVGRTHIPKTHVRGVYDASTGLTRVRRVKGHVFRSLGRDMRGGGVELLPEEALWLLERGSLDIRWGQEEDVVERLANGGNEAHDEATLDAAEEELLPMSLQGAYAAMIGEDEEGRGALTLEKYQVFAGLKRVGYIVLRAAEWDDEAQIEPAPRSSVLKNEAGGLGLYSWLYNMLFTKASARDVQRECTGPLVAPGLHRSYSMSKVSVTRSCISLIEIVIVEDVYRLLHIIPSADPLPSFTRSDATSLTCSTSLLKHESKSAQSDGTRTPFRTTYNLHKPIPNFRKSAAGEPSFRICVVSARDAHLPTLAELSSLLAEQKDNLPPTASGSMAGGVGTMYARLKHGKRNVVLAVVDEGVVSYLRIADSNFASEKLWDRDAGPNRGGKGAGRGRGGGRGRGRGRGGRGG